MEGLLKPDLWKKILASDLPGEQAQMEMSPEFRGEFAHAANPVPAAVLILLYPKNGQPTLVFIRRNTYAGPHSAQVSFPGGIIESWDASAEMAALRETGEELGISGPIEILGTLTTLYIPVSNFLVTPVAGFLPARPEFDPDPAEVQYIIEASLPSLMNPGIRTSDRIHRHGEVFQAPGFKVGEERIWGATAMMLNEYLQLAAALR